MSQKNPYVLGASHKFMKNQPCGRNAVAYCHLNAHKGALSKNMLKQHQCLAKQCPFLEKYEDHPYWKERARKKAEAKAAKKQIYS